MSASFGVQVSNLRDNARHITTHDPATGKAVVHSSTLGNWISFDDAKLGFNVVYTTSKFPPNLNDDEDIKTHEEVVDSRKLGLVNYGGTVCRTVDLAPEYTCMMHRTQSLDYGIVVQGSIELILDSGETRLMYPGDVAIQRATMHAWRNPSKTEWARVVFVLQDCQAVKMGDKVLGEDLGAGTKGIPSSRRASL